MFKDRKKVIRLVPFLLAAVIAVGALVTAVFNLLHRDPGYYDVGFTNEANAVLYGSGLHLQYYAEGGSSEIRATVNEAQKAFSDAALRFYRLLDADEEFDGVVNLATLNAHPGEVFPLDDDLYAVLADALERTGRGEGYSVFSGALHREWRDLRYLEEPAERDPLNDPDEMERIRALTAAVNGPDALTLTLDPENKTACLRVTDAYRQVMDALEMDAPALDLNLLHDAYLMGLVARELKSQGRTAGYLYTESGLSVALRPGGEMAFQVWGAGEGGAVEAGEVRLPTPCAYCQFTAFSPTGEKYGYYSVAGQAGETRLRHAWLDARTGDFGNQLLTLSLAGEEGEPVTLAYEAAVLNAQASPEALAARLEMLPEGLFCAYTLQSDPASLRTGPGAVEKRGLKVSEGFSLIP